MPHDAIHSGYGPAEYLRTRNVSDSVVIPGLEEVDPIVAHDVYQTVFLSDTSVSHARARILERLGPPNAAERVSHDRFD